MQEPIGRSLEVENEAKSANAQIYESILRSQDREIPSKDGDIKRVKEETERKVRVFLERVGAQAVEQRLLDNPVIAEVVRSFDQAYVREMSRVGRSREEKKVDLSPELLQQFTDALKSGEYFLDMETVQELLDAGIPLPPQLFEELRHDSEEDIKPPVLGPRARSSGWSRPIKIKRDPDFVDPRVAFKREQRARLNARYRVTASEEELQEARLLAATKDEIITAENKNLYQFYNEIVTNVGKYLDENEMSNADFISFFQKLTAPTQEDTDFWLALLPDDIQRLDLEKAQKYADFLKQDIFITLFEQRGLLQPDVVEQIYDRQICTDDSLIPYVDEANRSYYLLFIEAPAELREVLQNNKDTLGETIQDGEPTQELLLLFAQENPEALIKFLSKDRLSTLFGEEKAQRFLAALPQSSDRRNALTHNDYDRTSAFLLYFVRMQTSEFRLVDDIDIVTEFIEEFGLSKSAEIFNIFKLVYEYEHELVEEKPEIIDELGIESLETLKKEVKEIKQLVSSVEPLNAEKLKKLSKLQKMLLPIITGKTTHRFDSGRPSFDRILQDYMRDEEAGNIEALGPEYQVETFELVNVEIEFDATPIEEEFALISDEIKDSIAHRGTTEGLIPDLLVVLQDNVVQAELALDSIPEKGRPFAQKKIENLKDQIAQLQSEQKISLDDLLLLISQINFSNRDQSFVSALTRKIILRKTFEQHFSPQYIENVLSLLDRDISPNSISAVLNIVNELVKQHVLSATHEEQGLENYWSNQVQDLLTNKKHKKKAKEIKGVFNDIREKLQETDDSFELVQQSGSTTVQAIPSRDFVGEMSGYLADVCYTKEYPLLKERKVVPYKFVTEAGKELEGSVLVFEVMDAEGNECLLVRGFDYKEEMDINIAQLIEGFLDRMQEVAKKQGKKHVLVPGIRGAISNYDLTINHINARYVNGNEPHKLGETFDFNGYDLTNNVYIARTV